MPSLFRWNKRGVLLQARVPINGKVHVFKIQANTEWYLLLRETDTGEEIDHGRYRHEATAKAAVKDIVSLCMDRRRISRGLEPLK